MLSGIDEPGMKYAFITSLPKEISSKTFHLIKVKNKTISSTSLGEIFQHMIEVVEKFCSQHSYFKNMMKAIINIKPRCKRLDFFIKCDDEKICVCKPKKKKHFKKYKFSPCHFKSITKSKMSYL